ncbi:MAG: S9 family peptidase, partial [Bacteroidales bacterium]|nr:S9 family peptidase [Bacteroidales bacterium]
KKSTLYESSQKVEYLYIDPDEKGLMVCERNSDDSSQQVLYLDLKNKMTYPLKKVLPVTIQRGFTEVIREGSAYFLTVLTEKEKPGATVADIWYGNDNQLEEKFYPPIETLTYVWEPHKHLIREMGNDHLTTSVNMGNDRYFLSFNPWHFQDYTSESTPLQLFVYDRIQDRYSMLDTIARKFYLSGDGEYALSPKDEMWYLYHIPSGNKNAIEEKGLGIPWFTNDGNAVLFEGEGALWKYELKKGILTEAAVFKGYQTSIINGERDGISAQKGSFSRNHVNLLKPLVIKLYDPLKNLTSYALWLKGKTEIIIPPTPGYIQYLNYDDTYKHFSYVEEDYNIPPRLIYRTMGIREKVLFQSNKSDKSILSLKQEIISYTNSDGIPLKGILYYPLQYLPSKKYPMVVHIYEKQNFLANRYLYSSYYERLGFNIRLLIEKGYFVYLPDIVMQGKNGPGTEALDCINSALDALLVNPLIDTGKIGLIGHSFGGYETNFIATHSNRFAAYVSGSGHSDILWAYHSFNYNFYFPDYVRIEANMYKFGKPFICDKDLYFRNNPVYYADKVNAPVLLWSGLEDQNVTSDHSMAFYSALRRNNKDVIALFYNGEGHNLLKLQTQFDLTSRILDWFDYFLYNETEIEWISKGINKKRLS